MSAANMAVNFVGSHRLNIESLVIYRHVHLDGECVKNNTNFTCGAPPSAWRPSSEQILEYVMRGLGDDE